MSIAAVLALAFVPSSSAPGGDCEPLWEPTFGSSPGVDGGVLAFAAFDDGSGPALFVGGGFVHAGGLTSEGVARWDGDSWSELGELGEQIEGTVRALAVFDDGGGPALYAGGSFGTAGAQPASNVARWDGESWSPLGLGVDGAVRALCVFDDGGGPALYAGGTFANAGGEPAKRVARWDGTAWSAVGDPGGTQANALVVYDDGAGPALYAGGVLSVGASTFRVVRWSGGAWNGVGTLFGNGGVVHSLAVFDSALHAGGEFQFGSGNQLNHVARLDGTSWEPLGIGVHFAGIVRRLAVHDDGTGEALYVGGSFYSANGAPASRVARWDGAAWTTLGAGTSQDVHAFAPFDPGGGEWLYVGGAFAFADGKRVNFVASWDGAAWAALGRGLDGTVSTLARFDDGGGEAVYVGGMFLQADGVDLNRIARWDGASFQPLGAGVDDIVTALAAYDDGSGPALYAAGFFTSAGGVPASYVALWDGESWSAVGGGLPNWVRSLVVFDDGGGPALYAAGQFQGVARWDGANWDVLDGAGDGTLAVLDDGSGPALFISGSGGVLRWDGAAWRLLGGLFWGGGSSPVIALAAFDDGGGPALYAAGDFDYADDDVPAKSVARWDGASWSEVGGGIVGHANALVVHDDGGGRGPSLYVGGQFSHAGGVAIQALARWDGSSWSRLGRRLDDTVDALLAIPAAGGAPAELIAAGPFRAALGSGDSFVARWVGCLDETPPILSCPLAIVEPDPLTSPPGEVVTFVVTASDEADPTPSVTCVPPSGSFFPVGTTLVQCTATDDAGNESTCEFPVTVKVKTRAGAR